MTLVWRTLQNNAILLNTKNQLNQWLTNIVIPSNTPVSRIHTAGVASSKLASPTKIQNWIKHLNVTLSAFLASKKHEPGWPLLVNFPMSFHGFRNSQTIPINFQALEAQMVSLDLFALPQCSRRQRFVQHGSVVPIMLWTGRSLGTRWSNWNRRTWSNCRGR